MLSVLTRLGHVCHIHPMSYYTDNAPELFDQYLRIPAGEIHAGWKSFLPASAGLACDIGAGSGRDANWLASIGWDVIAVEPNKALRELAIPAAHARVTFMEDALPGLASLRSTSHHFDLILLSAVWMHVPVKERERAFRIVTDLLAPGGLLVITLRQSSIEETDRQFHPVSADEVIGLANRRAIALVQQSQSKDELGRGEVTWQTLAFKMPDDGTGGLPLLRHIIVNDNKSSTYKLGLLRALVKIAEGAPGMVSKWTDTHVEIPFGLVALYWLKLYIPLIQQRAIAQGPLRKNGAKPGYGFVNKDFDALATTSTFSLRVGARFSGDFAAHLTGALRSACQLIQQMPTRFITWPGQASAVFDCEYRSVRKSVGPVLLDKAFLRSFGSFSVPLSVWQTMGQYACWLEPAILSEWKALMQGWEHRYGDGIYDQGLQWDEGRRDTNYVRNLVGKLQENGQQVSCVWTNTRLRNSNYSVDHCFPWSYWSNNDLWNLMPSTNIANGSKSNGIPDADLMRSSRQRILQWWEMAYLNEGLADQFYLEAETALPGIDETKRHPEKVFEALQLQRLRLRRDQQLREWRGISMVTTSNNLTE